MTIKKNLLLLILTSTLSNTQTIQYKLHIAKRPGLRKIINAKKFTVPITEMGKIKDPATHQWTANTAITDEVLLYNATCKIVKNAPACRLAGHLKINDSGQLDVTQHGEKIIYNILQEN